MSWTAAHVKVLAWYDNDVGISNRLVELAALVGATHARAAAWSDGAASPKRRGDLRKLRDRGPPPLGGPVTDGADPPLTIAVLLLRAGYAPFRVASLCLFYELLGSSEPRRRLLSARHRPQGHAP